MFIDINIFESKFIIIDIARSKLIIDNCDIEVSLLTKSKKKRIKRVLYNKKQITISTYTTIIISIKYRDKAILSDRDYNFLSKSNQALDFDNKFLVYIVNANVKVV